MGVALENARLFDETQRLLKETEQRNAELAVINSVQQGIAGSLDFQGIVDLVGDRLREVLHTGDISIRWFDHDRGMAHRLYDYEHGVRLTLPSVSLAQASAATHRLIDTRRHNVYHTVAEQIAAGVQETPGTDRAISMAYVPIVVRDRVVGVIGLEDHEREHAFGEPEVRLLQTIANSMGMALESARLFDETQRLLKVTEQRAAELAVINGIQRGMSEKLDFQAIVDLVGDKLREVFKTGDIGIWWWEASTRTAHALYVFEHGVRHPNLPFPIKPGGAADRILTGREVVRGGQPGRAERERLRGGAGHRSEPVGHWRPDPGRRPRARLDHAGEPRARAAHSATPTCAC